VWFNAGMPLRHRSRSAKLAWPLAAVVGSALLISACGDDGDGTEAATTTGGTNPAAEIDNSDGAEETGSSGVELAAEDLPDACTLLDEADVESVVGPAPTSEADSGENPLFDSFAQCTWDRTDDAEGVSALAVSVIAGNTFDDYDQEVFDPETVDGLGERAITIPSYAYATGGGTGTSVVVDQGSVIVIVGARGSVGLSSDGTEFTPEDNPDLSALAETVLDRIEL
jgi:hypothetical protein